MAPPLLILLGTFIDVPTSTNLRIRTNHICIVNRLKSAGFRGNIILLRHVKEFLPDSFKLNNGLDGDSNKDEEEEEGIIDKLTDQQINDIIVKALDFSASLRRLGNDNKIIKILRTYQSWDVVRMKDHKQFVVPGMVDLHLHAPQYAQLGTHTDLPLLQWLSSHTFPLESLLSTSSSPNLQSQSLSHHLYTALSHKLLSSCTTTCLFYSTEGVEDSIELAECWKGRGGIGIVSTDRLPSSSHPVSEPTPGTSEAVLRTRRFLELMEGKGGEWDYGEEFRVESDHKERERKSSGDGRRERIWGVITPRFLPSCTLPLLSSLSQLSAQYNAPVQTHAAETPDQVDSVRELFRDVLPKPDSIAPGIDSKDEDRGGRDIPILDSLGLLKPGTILAHCVHLDFPAGEVEVMKSRGVGVASCPLSNFMFSGGVTPVHRLRKYGIGTELEEKARKEEEQVGVRVGLGSDVSGGWEVRMWGKGGVGTWAVAAGRVSGFVRWEDDQKGHWKMLNDRHDENPSPDSKSHSNQWSVSGGLSTWPIDWIYVFHLATFGGAGALRIDDLVGKFEEPESRNEGMDLGMEWDAGLMDVDIGGSTNMAFDRWREEIDGSISDGLDSTTSVSGRSSLNKKGAGSTGRKGWSWKETVERWWNLGDERNVRTVWVMGKEVFERQG